MPEDEETTEAPEESTEETPGVETPEADAISSSVYEAKIAALTTENLSLTAALMQAKADNYDLLMSSAQVPETETTPSDSDEPDELDAVFL